MNWVRVNIQNLVEKCITKSLMSDISVKHPSFLAQMKMNIPIKKIGCAAADRFLGMANDCLIEIE
ncbi:hypothetical protein [Bacillus cereus]|uniref:hypothetical protein n=1 Tax=Bacillus cereus TaxID=1396 RepID=UPI001CC2279E|nr:hypothetical protein [Bacillus cereus]